MIGLLLAGCQFGPDKPAGDGPGARIGAANNHGSRDGADSPPGRPIAFVDDRAITDRALRDALLEAAGGQVLAEYVLDRRLARRLGEKGVQLTDQHVKDEKAIFLAALDPDKDQAVRLMRELRKQGPRRFDQFLWRDAALRLLVQDQVTVSDAAVRQAFELQYGRRYEARLIVVNNVTLATRIVRMARGQAKANGADNRPVPGGGAAKPAKAPAGPQTFIDLVLEYSTDDSRAQGGLLPSISPVDPTWPDGVRKAVVTLEPGQVSDPIAIDNGFAILRLERTIKPQPVPFDDVKQELTIRVHRNVERTFMQSLARTLLREADVVVVHPALRDSWQAHRDAMFKPK